MATKKTTRKGQAAKKVNGAKKAKATTKRATKVSAKAKPKQATAQKGRRGGRRTKPSRKAAVKLTALDAAAKVLAQADEPLGCRALIEVMSKRGYWTSPAGKTPHQTLYAAIYRETQTKGCLSRFVKADRGRFALAKAPATKA